MRDTLCRICSEKRFYVLRFYARFLPSQAGIYLPAGSPPLPGSVKWQRPERKKMLGIHLRHPDEAHSRPTTRAEDVEQFSEP